MLFLRTRLPLTLEQVSKIYPWLEIRVRFQEIGIFSIEPGASTTTKNPNLSSNLQNMTINVTPQVMASTTVHATSTTSANTIGMENTGTPINYIIMAFLLIMSGLIVSKRR